MNAISESYFVTSGNWFGFIWLVKKRFGENVNGTFRVNVILSFVLYGSVRLYYQANERLKRREEEELSDSLSLFKMHQ